MKKIMLNNFFFLKWNYYNLLNVVLLSILKINFLMFSYLNYFSLIKTIFNKYCNYYSRTKNNFWFKGFYSKNFQIFKKFYFDCDMDILIIYILQLYKITCHTNNFFCNINKIN